MGRTGEGRAGATRRRVLAVGAAAATAVAAGCSSPAREPEALPAGMEEVRVEEARRRLLVAHSTVLRERYDAVIARHPRLAERLGALREAVAEHEKALLPGGVRASGTPSSGVPSEGPSGAASGVPSGEPSGMAASGVPSGTASPSPGAAASAPGVGVSADPGTALKELAAAERRTSDAFAAALVDAEPELARLLASVAAAGAAHAYLLTHPPAEGAR
ncbi:hypothetical protein [Streptomyces sp. PR69]|uniref:hypothetical protein n=1 Tax=Streptomyces sp. PR69 TaxID=2984950 RepID=UPI002264044E|nr:hypothetical protein [Streptomyces sp. PR69]